MFKAYYKDEEFLEREIHEEFSHYVIDKILGVESTLTMNSELFTVSLLTIGFRNRAIMIGEIQATPVEFTLLAQILDNFPHPATYDLLHAAYHNKEVNDRTIENSREFLINAEENRIWETEVKPIRGSISRLRLKLHTMELDIVAVLRTGYTLAKFANHRYFSQ